MEMECNTIELMECIQQVELTGCAKPCCNYRTYGRGRTNITIRIGGTIQRIQQNNLIERIEHVQLI